MKTIKPQRLGLLTKVYEDDGAPHLVVTLLVFFSFRGARRVLPEVELWKFVGAELGTDAILDEGMWKPRGEVLVTGRCFAPGGAPCPATYVRVQIGRVDKKLYVIGDRIWKHGVPSDPVPFTEMPITWQRAFGGPGFPQNPLGKGESAVQTEQGTAQPLPNVELPDCLVRSPRERPPPASFGPIDLAWPQRFSKVGTYDRAWLEERFPGFAKDLDPSFFNTAPEDQRIEGWFRGDEPFVIENMHPGEPRLEAALPAVSARCFMQRRTPDGEVLREIPTRIDTVRLFPHAERGIAVFRGVARVREDDASDVLVLLCGLEAMDAPKPASHYETVLAQRLDKKKGHLYLLRDAELMPEPGPGAAEPPPERTEEDALASGEGLVLRNLRRKAEKELEQARAQMLAAGIDPAGKLPELPPAAPPPRPEDLPEVLDEAMEVAEQAMASEKARREAAEAEARRACAAAGVDYDEMVRKAQREAAGPPKFSAQRELERLRDLATLFRNAGMPSEELETKLADPELEERLLAAEENLRGTYRRFAHYFPAAAALPGEEAAGVRRAVIAGRAAGERFAGRDLTGADLSGLDLTGLDFRDALLESANLSGARLSGADLSGAVLARADLSGADLRGAKLAGANLGSARLSAVDLGEGADLTGAVLAGADLRGARLRGAQLARADLSDATFEGTDGSEIDASGTHFIKASLGGVKLAGARLERCVFIEADVTGVDFTGAKLVSAVFVGARGDGAQLRSADLENLRVVKGSSFAGADFSQSNLKRANLRGANLDGADFSGASMAGADLSEASLRSAKLTRVMAQETLLIRADLTRATLERANLMYGVLQKARLDGADLRGANLFRADLAKVRLDTATNLEGAHVVEVRVVKDRSADDPG